MTRHAGEGQLDLFAAAVTPAGPAAPARRAPATPPPAAPCASEPMSPAAVAWIEQHVIADFHLANEDIWWCGPDQDWSASCACQLPCPCTHGQHDRCRALYARPDRLVRATPETHLRRPAAYRLAQPGLFTPVWLADRVCRPLCQCPTCGTHTPATTVVCLKGRQGDPLLSTDRFVYVGRPMFQGGWRLHGHLLANPFKVGKDGSADEVVARYEDWLTGRPALLERELPALRGKVLGCWCADGQPCHARVLAALADREAQR
ncbi:DUF4326 domain-containing protein [Streptomyces sp. NPDC048389]|uniref:DUF4326 domain-containing protein n=1 Tax=Streptomyces sp. NPDC048389 TaxID=3154622 RepID=UPI00345196F9